MCNTVAQNGNRSHCACVMFGLPVLRKGLRTESFSLHVLPEPVSSGGGGRKGGAWTSSFSLHEWQLSERVIDDVSSWITWRTRTEPPLHRLHCLHCLHRPSNLASRWVASARGREPTGLPPAWCHSALRPPLVWPCGPQRTARARLQRHRPPRSALCRYGH